MRPVVHWQIMYRKILTAEFTAPEEMSAEAASLCRQMLAREPTDRLGYRGAAEVRRGIASSMIASVV